MIGRELEAYVDDVCLSGDDFEVNFTYLKKFFQHCREKQLFLTPQNQLVHDQGVVCRCSLIKGWDQTKP